MDDVNRIATDFCKLVEVNDLFEYLGIARDTPPDQAKEALAKKRKYMQAMQANPKFKDSARYLIKHYRALEEVIEQPQVHLEAVRRVKEDQILPLLIIALDGVLNDGRLTQEEEGFVRKLAIDFGVSVETYERVLKERAAFHDAVIEVGRSQSALLDHAEDSLDSFTLDTNTQLQKLKGAEGHTWWGPSFTRLLLECIPGGPGEMVDIYCRTALSAETLLPERRQLTYLGVDRSAERIAEARHVVAATMIDSMVARIALTTGEPHALPLEDESVDYVLAVRALANRDDTRPVFAEAMRVLRPGGRMIVAEPDGFGESFYFERNLDRFNRAFQALVVAVDAAQGAAAPGIGRPGLAIGPTLSARMLAAGFEPDAVRVHSSANIKQQRFGKFVKRLRKYPAAIAMSGGLQSSDELAAVLAEVDRLEAEIPGGAVGMGGHVLPMFVAVGIKD